MSSQPQEAICPEDDARVALDEVFGRLYDRIRLLAARIRWTGANPTLNPTTLVHEAYLKLQKSPPNFAAKSYEEVAPIFAHAMRQILVDAARRKGAQKRASVDLPERADLPIEDAIALDAAFEELARSDPRQARVFECRFFLGMTCDETAAALALSKKTVERDWQQAREWVAGKLQPAAG
jgi:RNA polymerase sigma factor (TIGR02999 family)